MGAKPVYPFGQVSTRLFATPWVRAALKAEDAADIEERAEKAGTTVVLVKRSRDGQYMARAGEGQAVGATAYGAALMALGRSSDCE